MIPANDNADPEQKMPTLKEVKAYLRGREECARRGIMVNLSSWGPAMSARMAEAEKRYRAMGLL